MINLHLNNSDLFDDYDMRYAPAGRAREMVSCERLCVMYDIMHVV